MNGCQLVAYKEYKRMIKIAVTKVLLTIGCLLPEMAHASGLSFGDFKFEFYGVPTLGTLIGGGCIWLGYKLFTKGIEKGKGQLDFKSKTFSLIFSGVGPGLFFMAFGALIILVAVIVTVIGSL